MKILFLILFGLTWAGPLWAGTEIKAHLESTYNPNAWVDITASIDRGRVKLAFWGPFCRGALMSDEKSSAITIVDDINKMVLPIGSATQTAFRMFEGLAGEGLKSQIQGATKGVKLGYFLAQINAQALFNGALVLEQKNVSMDKFQCDLYGTTKDGVKTREIWTVPSDQYGISPADYQTLQNLLNHLVDLLSPELKQLGADPDPFLQRGLTTELPTHLCVYLDGKIATRYKVTAIKPEDISLDVFDPPADYRVVGLMDLLHQ